MTQLILSSIKATTDAYQ